MPRKIKQFDVPETSQAELAKLQQEKNEYEARRDLLKADLFRTEQKITELQSKCGVIRNTSVPILKLPNEITCMIFDYALVLSVRMVEDLTMINGETKWPPGFEVVISHVCHQWRSIALSYPQLWSHFRYDIMHCSLVPSKRFDVYLERSRSMGLELWFNVRSASKTIGDIHKLLKKAVHHFARWRRFTLMADSATLVTSILRPIFQKSASAPMLEHFAICPAIGNDGQEVRKLEAMVFKKGAPNLRSVMLTLSATITCFPPIDNLTTIRLEKDSYCPSNVHFSWPVFRNLLSLRSLVNLSIMFDTFRESEFKPEKDQPIEMNSLKHLRIAKFDPFANLLLFIRAPLLESLTIKDIWF
ncbi:hypothetical protein CVT26_006463 [Gymnopilus dilepis]|uniref:Uncharacterized protein n=1 Tax=Gymnopilus dilepis TaxID=231916 RepID=A0A409YU07_9AGAR|nr:hypothetical protein CVT26_006463 [Gymnopilus dilepis]